MKILFWNINKNRLATELKALCDYYDVDILVLAENTMQDIDILPTLNKNTNRIFISPINRSEKITIYTRFHDFQIVHNDNWGIISKIVHPIGIQILLVCVHIQSKLHARNDDQAAIATRIVREIDNREQQFKHTRTIVIGDFNMNPFETGLISADGFHGVMDKNIALKQHRTVLGQQRKFFYNPMWSRLGDDSEGCAGSYYYDSSSITNYFWHTFDQVLLRPALLPCFTQSDLKVIDTINEHSLVKNGKILKKFSDHLPLFIKLNISNLIGDKNEQLR